jgi:hypothetical protein
MLPVRQASIGCRDRRVFSRYAGLRLEEGFGGCASLGELLTIITKAHLLHIKRTRSSVEVYEIVPATYRCNGLQQIRVYVVVSALYGKMIATPSTAEGFSSSSPGGSPRSPPRSGVSSIDKPRVG